MKKTNKNKSEKVKSWDVVKTTMQYLYPPAWKQFKGYFFCGFIRLLIDAIQPFVLIMISPLLIDELLGGRNVKYLLTYVAIIAVGSTLLSLIGSVLGCIMEKYDQKMQNYFTEQISLRVMELDFQLTEDKEALDQIEAARTGMSWYSGGVHGITTQLFNMISNIIKLVGVMVLIAIYAPLLFALILVLLVFNVLIRHKMNQLEVEAYARLSKLNRVWGYLCWNLTDFQYGKEIRLYDAKDMMVTKWGRYTDEMNANWKKNADDNLKWALVAVIIDVARFTLMYLYLGYLAIFGYISIGIFTQMRSASSTFQSSLEAIVWGVQEIVKKSNYAHEYVKFMNYPAAIVKGNKPVEEKEHIIEFKNVSFTYPNTDVMVLNHVNVTLTPGEHLSVVGLNGAGKTTFIKLLSRLYDPTEGEILLDGVNIKEYDYEEYMNLFAPVFQDFKLFAFSIKENITMDEKIENKEVEPYLSKVGLSEKLSTLSQGMDTMLFKQFEEDGIVPSGGEQQKLAIARALYKNSPVVILDEPTAALDPVAEYEIYRQFNDLVGGKTAIYISHRLSSCKFCDRIAVFSEGTIKEYGTHDELVRLENGIYAEMFAAQAQDYR